MGFVPEILNRAANARSTSLYAVSSDAIVAVEARARRLETEIGELPARLNKLEVRDNFDDTDASSPLKE